MSGRRLAGVTLAAAAHNPDRLSQPIAANARNLGFQMSMGHVGRKLRSDPQESANVLKYFNGAVLEILVEPDPHVPPKTFQIPAELLRVESELQERVVDAELPGAVAQLRWMCSRRLQRMLTISQAMKILGERPISRVA